MEKLFIAESTVGFDAPGVRVRRRVERSKWAYHVLHLAGLFGNFDMALHKTTKIGEGKSLEIRLETFNTSSHRPDSHPICLLTESGPN